MRFDTPSRLVMTCRSEKESKLAAFVLAGLTATDAPGVVTLVARGTDSPVASALVAALAQAGHGNVKVRIVLFDIDTIVEDHAAATILDVAGADIRVLPDSRFAAAHEQLVLGNARVWLGDCMRRDPAKRDAFAVFHDANVPAAQHAAQSFAKLWAVAKPLKRSVRRTMAPQALIAGQQVTDTSTDLPSRRG